MHHWGYALGATEFILRFAGFACGIVWRFAGIEGGYV